VVTEPLLPGCSHSRCIREDFALCEIVKRKASIDSATFTKKEILAAGARDIRTEALDLKERLKQLRKGKASEEALAALDTQVREKEKAARELESQAAGIDAAVFDLKAVNPNAVATADTRTPTEIITSIERHGEVVAAALARLRALLAADAEGAAPPTAEEVEDEGGSTAPSRSTSTTLMADPVELDRAARGRGDR
jgi:hypothetical protein